MEKKTKQFDQQKMATNYSHQWGRLNIPITHLRSRADNSWDWEVSHKSNILETSTSDADHTK